jgi:glycosyltransferase involved in cell wall biosynthesis
MRVVVTVEERFVRTSDGAVWTNGATNHQFCRHYLSTFEQVRVVARVVDAVTPLDGSRRVDGSDVEVWPVPYYVGPRGYVTSRVALGRAVSAAVNDTDAVILRVPSAIGALLAARLRRTRRPYGLEVIGDPYDVFAPGVVRHPLRPLLRRWFATTLRQQCRSAAAVAYVTEATLQARYPVGATALATAVSSVDLPPAAYVSQSRTTERTRTVDTIISVGSLEQLYKGIDTLIEALARMRAANRPLRLVHVGTGRYRPYLEELADRRGVAHLVTFTGSVPAGEPVRQQLDAADLFVMPSRTEGLPRALIEAMARALPAVASTVGGIPELLPTEDLVPPDDPDALATAITRLVTDPERMARGSARNLARARDFSAEALTPRRDAYYQAVRRATEGRTPAGSTVS